jgi:hypothetical protein
LSSIPRASTVVCMRNIRLRTSGQRRIAALATAAALALAAAAAASAKAYAPPPGTPDLARIALAPSDFAKAHSGSIAGYAFYYPPGTGPGPNSTLAGPGERAAYLREIEPVTTTGGVKLLVAFSDVALFDTPAAAHAQFAAIQLRYGAAQASQVLLKSMGGSGTKLKHAETLRSVVAGQEAVLTSLTVRTSPTVTIVSDWVWMRSGGVDVSIQIESAGPTLADSTAISLARTVAAHTEAVIGPK